MTDKERLIELIKQGNGGYDFNSLEKIADHLLKNGVIVAPMPMAEIERLKDENYYLRGYIDSTVKRMQHLFQSKTISQFDEIDRHTHQYKKDVLKFDEEFKRYKEAFDKMSEEKVFSVDLDIHSIKAEAIKEFAERLKKEGRTVTTGHGVVGTVVEDWDIDNLVKEMVGDN